MNAASLPPTIEPEQVRALQEQLAKYPMLFCKAVLIGQRPSRYQTPRVSTGTATFAELPSGPTIITCCHVVDEALAAIANDPTTLVQVGDAVIDLKAQLIDRNVELDIATIRPTEAQLATILRGEEIGTQVVRPVEWPPTPPRAGDYIAFGGYPAPLRTEVAFDELEFGTWSVGAMQLSSTSDRQFVCAFDRERWSHSYGNDNHLQLRIFGGMSGGPVFIARGLRHDLVGIIKEYSTDYDAIFFASLQWVEPSGRIRAAA